MEFEISEPFEIKPEAVSTDITEYDDKLSIGMFVIICCCVLRIHLSVFVVYSCGSLFITRAVPARTPCLYPSS